MGDYIPFKQPTDPRPPAGSYNSGSMASVSGNMSDAYNYGLGCMLHGMPTKCSTVMRLLGNGSIAGGVISGAGSPMASLMQLGVNLTVDRVYTAAVMRIPGSSSYVISRIVEGSSIEFTFLEKESHAERLNIIVFGVSMAPGRQPGVEPNRPTPQKNVPASVQRKILQNLRSCVRKLFNVELKSFTPATFGKNGTFVGFGYDSQKQEKTDITVTTDPSMYNHRDLTTMYNNFQKNHPEYRPLPRGYAGAGLTLPNSMVKLNDQLSESFIPYYNFVANDLYPDPNTSDWALEILHVHELGHALALITGKTQGAEDGDDLEFCVFGRPKPH